MIDIVYMILSFIILWVPAFILHEICHSIEGRRQGCKTRIEIWWHGNIPSMRCIVTKGVIKSKWLFALAGGLYSGILMVLVSMGLLPFIPWLAVAIGILGIINILYSFYEMKYLNKIPLSDYMKYHYYVYVVGGIIGLVVFSGVIGGMIW